MRNRAIRRRTTHDRRTRWIRIWRTLTPVANGYDIEARVRTTAQTGVEMEALHAVAVAALTIYDMVKAVDKRMVIGNIRLIHKSGGQSGDFRR